MARSLASLLPKAEKLERPHERHVEEGQGHGASLAPLWRSGKKAQVNASDDIHGSPLGVNIVTWEKSPLLTV